MFDAAFGKLIKHPRVNNPRCNLQAGCELRIGIMVVGAALVCTAAMAADTSQVSYSPLPAWVLSPPVPLESPALAGAAVRVKYSDTQIREVDGVAERFISNSLTILKPEALEAGNITVAWQPNAGGVTIHYVRIVRGGKVIDVLDGSKFRVVERESNLEQSVLDGNLTAVLQVPGLQVGDTLEYAITVSSHDAIWGHYVFGLNPFPTVGVRGAYRLRVIWPESEHLNFQATKDVPTQHISTSNGMKEVVYELNDPVGSIPTDGAPSRFNIRRLVEFAGFDNWQEVSGQLWPAYKAASLLGAKSAIKAEVSRIASEVNDPVMRASRALTLVEDRIRYVYVGFNGGNSQPASIEETWARKFGDCKAKTVLLLAILRDLGVSAEPVAVALSGGDGIGERLPSPIWFNHVLVRAHIGSRTYWLDATRTGDTNLDSIPDPLFRWALPIRDGGAPLEAIEAHALRLPSQIEVIDIDALAGIKKDAKVTTQLMLHGDPARALLTTLESLPSEDIERQLKSQANKSGIWSNVESAVWKYDADNNVLTVKMTGTWRLDWQGNDSDGYSLSMPGGGFYPPDERHRPKEQDQSAPWERSKFPYYQCWATTIHLPPNRTGWRWRHNVNPMNQTIGGTQYWRIAGMRNEEVRSVMSNRILVPEISAAEAESVNKAIPSFDNLHSTVSEESANEPNFGSQSGNALPFADDSSWAQISAACSARKIP